MAFLERFPAEEKDMLVALPYRVGLWVSVADQTGSSVAAAQEMAELEKIILQKGGGMYEFAFAHEIMAEIHLRKDKWQEWSLNLGNVPDNCVRAVTVISSQLGAHELDGYRQNIMSIAVAVAGAFREFDDTATFPVRAWTYFKLAVDRVIGLFIGQTYDAKDILNISYAEDMALARLADSFGLNPDGGLTAAQTTSK